MARIKENWQEIEVDSLPKPLPKAFKELVSELEAMNKRHNQERVDLTEAFYDEVTQVVENHTGQYVKKINIKWGNLSVVLQASPVSSTKPNAIVING